jgi:membrane protease subunit (stomatin/prohibitin family)
MPADGVMEAGSVLMLPDGRLAGGTRRGEIYLATGADATPPARSAPANSAVEGGATAGSKFCPECGTKVAAAAKFCPKCGAKIQ